MENRTEPPYKERRCYPMFRQVSHTVGTSRECTAFKGGCTWSEICTFFAGGSALDPVWFEYFLWGGSSPPLPLARALPRTQLGFSLFFWWGFAPSTGLSPGPRFGRVSLKKFLSLQLSKLTGVITSIDSWFIEGNLKKSFLAFSLPSHTFCKT